MCYYEAKPKKLSKLGVVLIDNQDQVLEMEERPTTPKSNWCGPPIYYHTKQDTKLVDKRI